MEDKITSWFNHLYRKSYALYVIANIFAGLLLFGSLVAIIVVTIFSYLEENKSALSIFGEIFVNTISSIVGVLLAYFLYRFLFLVSHHNEDKNKVSYSNADMWKQYGTEYRHQFTLHDNHNFTVYFEKLLKKGEFTSLKIMDDPNDYFSLDPFIKNHFFDLNDAHVMSETTNSVTVRLKEVIPADANGVATIKTMRSTYLSHLLTNRALDYELKTGVTIRSLFENTNHLVPLQRNHIAAISGSQVLDSRRNVWTHIDGKLFALQSLAIFIVWDGLVNVHAQFIGFILKYHSLARSNTHRRIDNLSVAKEVNTSQVGGQR